VTVRTGNIQHSPLNIQRPNELGTGDGDGWWWGQTGQWGWRLLEMTTGGERAGEGHERDQQEFAKRFHMSSSVQH
jgi:hypothetical protein